MVLKVLVQIMLVPPHQEFLLIPSRTIQSVFQAVILQVLLTESISGIMFCQLLLQVQHLILITIRLPAAFWLHPQHQARLDV